VNTILNTDEVINYPDAEFQAGIALIDTKTGEIRAIGGGRNQEVSRGFNYAIDTQRQPGSTIKPVLDYAPAIEYLNWGTYQTIDDKPIKYSTGQEFGNWDNKYMGAISMRTALQYSRNTPAVQALQQVGLEKAKDFAINLGIPLKEIYESYAIGGFGGKTVGVSPLQMAGAYSAFGNNGMYTKPYAVKKIVLRDGTVLDTAPESKLVMKDSTAFMTTDMLKSVLVSPGTGTTAKVPGLPIAGKTGTTNYTEDEMKKWNITDSRAVPDAWFTGYTTNYTASVWTGYSNRSTPIQQGADQKIAQLIFKNLMEYVSKDIKTSDFPIPDSVQKVRVEKGSKPPALASEFTPDSEVITEYAVKGHAPKTVSEKFNKITAPSNPKAVYDAGKNNVTLTWDYSNPENATVQFEITVSDGIEPNTSTVTERVVTLQNPTPGTTYSITITAIIDGKRSDPATTSVQIPLPQQDQTDEGNGNGNGNGNNGNGEGDGTGEGDGNGDEPVTTEPENGNGNGNGNANGNGNGNGG
jgi:penicillin-binding protein 1A